MIRLESRPLLCPAARLRVDRRTRQTLLVAAERGLLLNDVARAIVERCTGERDVATIVDELAGAYARGGRDRLEREVLGFLRALDERGLLAKTSPPNPPLPTLRGGRSFPQRLKAKLR